MKKKPYQYRTLTLLISVFLFSGIESALARNFLVLKGQRVNVCSAYKKHLDTSTPPENVPPGRHERLICAREIPKEFAGFSQPEWQVQVPVEREEIVGQILDYSLLPTDYYATTPLFRRPESDTDYRARSPHVQLSLVFCPADT